MQFLILAYDDVDDQAAQRRIDSRCAHLEGVESLKKEGHFIQGGAILDDEGSMIGSTLYMDFPSRAELDQWLKNDPYVTGSVWKEITIKPIKLV